MTVECVTDLALSTIVDVLIFLKETVTVTVMYLTP